MARATRSIQRRAERARSEPKPSAARPPERGEPEWPGAASSLVLGALSPRELEALSPELEMVKIAIGDVIYAADERIEEVYFPLNGVLSILAAIDRPRMVEVGTVGNEAFAGWGLLLGAERAPLRIICQVPGFALRMKTADYLRAIERIPPLRDASLRAVRALLQHAGRNAACNAAHTVGQRCARWILEAHDRVGSDLLLLTHEVLSQMLVVRRPGVTAALGELQRRGLIRSSRGKVMVMDRKGLEDAACVCYRIIQEEQERLMGRRPPR